MAYGNVNVDTVTTSTAGGILGAGNASIMKNRIINGAMVIDQRNAGASITPTADGTYSVDRWCIRLTQASKISMQQNAGSVTTPAGFVNYLGLTSTSSYSATSTDIFTLEQVIEGYNMSDFAWGTANAKNVTLSFWVYSSKTGTFGGSLFGNPANYSYPFTYSIPVANTWTQISVSIAGPTGGTGWTQTTGAGIYLNFDLGSGSTRLGTSSSWASAQYWGATGCQSIVATNGATFYITGVQLEVGSSATGFEYRLYNQELSACQRYYVQFLGNNSYENLAGGMSSTNQNGYAVVALPVTMRSNPTLTYSTVSSTLRWTELANSFNGTAIGIDQSSTKTPQIYITVASGMTSYRAGFITANGTTSAYVGFSAEL